MVQLCSLDCLLPPEVTSDSCKMFLRGNCQLHCNSKWGEWSQLQCGEGASKAFCKEINTATPRQRQQ